MLWKEDYFNSPILNTEGCSNLVDCVLLSIKKYKNAVAQIDAVCNQNITFDEIRTKTQQAAAFLFNKGIKHGDVVSICSANNIDYCWQILAVLNTGASCALISSSSTPRELKHSINITKPKAIIGKHFSDEQLKVLEEAEFVKYIWLENVPLAFTKCESSSCLLQELEEHETLSQWTGLCPAEGNDTAFILSSSGTTGLPKGVLLSHNNLITMLSHSGIFMRHNGTAIGLMPFCHAYGLGLMLMALYEGTKMVVLPKFSLKTFINVIESFKVSHLHIVPSLLTNLAKNHEVNSKTLSTIQEVFTGAGAILTKHQRAFISKLSATAKIYHSYGMTESTFVVLFAECRFDKPGSAGKLLPGVTAKVISEDGEELKEQLGELCLKGNLIMKGYLNNPEATSEAIDQYRWLHTGDLAYFDSDGYFYIVDRIKEMIKYQGHQISPTELELVLLTHPAVSEVAVVGVPHEEYGEVPKAFVVSNNCESVTAEELSQLVKNELSHYKQLRGGVSFVTTLPTSPTGKILRKHLLH
ncbi:uncharacterized protein [Rhodnius prolixus]|uniref:uncharacterized protein n=1 Tax=Rhodnius prolixus TaxID=13249 RepID=UPI003D18A135